LGLRENLITVTAKTYLPPVTKKIFNWQIAFSIIGLATSLYLLIHHTRLESGIQESASFCSVGKFMDCDAVNVSRYSEIFGIPIAALGAVYFFLLLGLSLLVPPQDKAFAQVQKILAWMTGAATIYNLVLFFGIQLLILKTLCLMCFLTYLCTGGHLFLNVSLAGQSASELKKKLALAFSRPDIGLLKGVQPIRWIFGALSLVTFVALISILPYFIRSRSSANTFVENSIQQFFAEWKEMPQRRLPVSENDATWGNPNSPIQIVEFSDFECPFCRKAAFTLHTTLRLFEKKVYFIFKNFPLDSSCNPNLPYQLHAHACRLAKLAHCALAKGKFWDYHDRAFLHMTDEDIKQGFDHISEVLGPVFNQEEITNCLNNPKAAAQVTENIEAGMALKIKATPSVFINGKLVTIPLTVESLEKLITMEESLFK
jgi:protein-disulfide isomerase/uncharacterized membrane protein